MRLLLIIAMISLSSALIPDTFAELKQSDEMKQFLKDRLVGKHDVKIDGLTRLTWTWEHLEQLRKDSDFEAFQVPYPKQVSDYFQYEILRQRKTNQFLVVKTGGIAGVFEIYSSSPGRNSR